jgi:hypothetical protein
LKEQIRVARNARNIKDISKLLTSNFAGEHMWPAFVSRRNVSGLFIHLAFELLCKVFDKTQAVMTREGLTIPRFYIRALVEVEDFTKEQWEDKESRSVREEGIHLFACVPRIVFRRCRRFTRKASPRCGRKFGSTTKTSKLRLQHTSNVN